MRRADGSDLPAPEPLRNAESHNFVSWILDKVEYLPVP